MSIWTPLSFHAPSGLDEAELVFHLLGRGLETAFQFQHALFVDLGGLIGNHLFRDHGVEHGVFLDQVLEHGAQFFRGKLIAKRF